jgi:decaprenylphospho-beta-D-erythro-pentofuranosid-2-ulose 2-reductase
MHKNVLILGATSDMAVAIAKKFAMEGDRVILAARNIDKLKPIESDIQIRYNASVTSVAFDALNFESHETFYRALSFAPDIVVCVFGLLGDQSKAQSNWKECAEIINSNYTGAVSILNVVANNFEAKKQGTIVGISSVAGERGRQSNYLYGSAKAGFTAYLSGLRNRLFPSNVHVLTVKPGFVKTKMIENLKTPGPITGTPDAVANKIYKAVEKKQNVIYVLPVWRLIMLIIKSIPEGVFKKLKL